MAIYIHVPFCRRKCKYCSFISFDSRTNDIPGYIDLLKKELELRSVDCNIDTVYFGGGTPSLLTAEQLNGILSVIGKKYRMADNAEITIEANPGTVDFKYLADIKTAGINRLSIGIQSFNDDELTMLGRIHTRKEAVNAIEDAREAGVDNLNIDLIYGLPGQSIDDWKENLLTAIGFNPGHLSLYALTLEPEESLFKEIESGKLPDISAGTAASQYELAEELLQKHGYVHYEISNWAQPGRECRHNLVYWQGSEYLGIGVAAHSYIGKRRSSNTEDLDKYINALSHNVLPPQDVDEIIIPELEIAESIILGLRLYSGISIKDFEKRFGIDIMKRFGRQIEELINFDLIENDKTVIRLTPRGRLLGNEVFWRFLPDKV
ncbi:MAG: radical SAM family heme chaperone HemW [Dehalococcoidales bacterium]|nr:radical SAM family heme chaperone HemW [Dehalococcoidales bacterium]